MKTTTAVSHQSAIGKLYAQFRATGYDAKQSHYSAKAVAEFRALESAGKVRIVCEPENENYFDVYGKPEAYEDVYGKPEAYEDVNGRRVSEEQATKEMEDMIERLGMWWTASEWFDGSEWQQADSCGMHTGYEDPTSPFENCYIVDEMRSAVDAYREHEEEQESEAEEAHSAACRDLVTV